MDKKEVLAAYLNQTSTSKVDVKDIEFEYDRYQYNGYEYLVFTEEEGDDYFNQITEEYDNDDIEELIHAGFNYLIPYIHFDEMHENENLLDYDFDEFNYNKETYYIQEQ